MNGQTQLRVTEFQSLDRGDVGQWVLWNGCHGHGSVFRHWWTQKRSDPQNPESLTRFPCPHQHFDPSSILHRLVSLRICTYCKTRIIQNTSHFLQASPRFNTWLCLSSPSHAFLFLAWVRSTSFRETYVFCISIFLASLRPDHHLSELFCFSSPSSHMLHTLQLSALLWSRCPIFPFSTPSTAILKKQMRESGALILSSLSTSVIKWENTSLSVPQRRYPLLFFFFDCPLLCSNFVVPRFFCRPPSF